MGLAGAADLSSSTLRVPLRPRITAEQSSFLKAAQPVTADEEFTEHCLLRHQAYARRHIEATDGKKDCGGGYIAFHQSRQDPSMFPHDKSGGANEDPPEGDTSLLLQPDTRPITAEQLQNEIIGIYVGLVMVEKECVKIIAQRASTGRKLINDQWQALSGLRRAQLHQHLYDFFVRPFTLP